MKSHEQIRDAIAKKVETTWADDVLAELTGSTERTWPRPFPTGAIKSSDIERDLYGHARKVQAYREWATRTPVRLEETEKRVAGAKQPVISRVHVDSLDSAAAIAGAEVTGKVAATRQRLPQFVAAVPECRMSVVSVRKIATMAQLDVDIAVQVAAWFAVTPEADRSGLTPRQIPLPGVHAKWLNKHARLIADLVGVEDLGFAPAHPARVHFTYLDQRHLEAGGRKHDSYSVGDTWDVPYQPRVVVISENKDTAIGFPNVDAGIAIEGAGSGGGTVAAIPWLTQVDRVLYWGDIDAAGLQILSQFRAVHPKVESLLMDVNVYREYCRFGTNLDASGNALPVPVGPAPAHLTAAEGSLWDLLASGNAPFLRLEQERIPLTVALEHLGSHEPPTTRDGDVAGTDEGGGAPERTPH